MNKVMLFLSILLPACHVQPESNPSDDRHAIHQVLISQQEAWNRGDIPAFMEGYLESDSLMFVGAETITYGYDGTLERYLNSYDSPEVMGELSFEVNRLSKITDGVYFMAGKFHLHRKDSIDDARGRFTLVWKKVNGEWKIVADHTE